jgi:hypothetical protein
MDDVSFSEAQPTLVRAGDAEEIVALVARTIRKTIKYKQREVKGVQSPSLTFFGWIRLMS